MHLLCCAIPEIYLGGFLSWKRKLQGYCPENKSQILLNDKGKTQKAMESEKKGKKHN
jgi:hypothetical protein